MDDCYCSVCVVEWHHPIESGIFFCQSFNTSFCFSDLKTAGHFLHLLLRADVSDPYRVLLKNDGVAEGQIQRAFQSLLLFPPLSGLSRKPIMLGNGGLRKILKLASPRPWPPLIFTLETTSRLSSLTMDPWSLIPGWETGRLKPSLQDLCGGGVGRMVSALEFGQAWVWNCIFGNDVYLSSDLVAKSVSCHHWRGWSPCPCPGTW